RRLLPGDAAPDLKVASCFPKMPPSISKSPATSPKCCTASQGGRLLPGDAARELQILNSFRRCRAASENRELLSGNAARPPDFPLSTLCLRALYQVWGSGQALLLLRRKNCPPEAVDFARRSPDFKRQILIFDSPLSILWEFIKYGLALADSRPPQKIFAAAVTNGASAGCSICATQSQLNDLIANLTWAG
ncbi:MAG: hypothetical protein DMG16_07550, partial [Acidobacteria bacterium]